MWHGNLNESIPHELPEELSQVLVQSGRLRIERIVSRGHTSPEGHWYDQDEHEWVLLVTGAARLEIEGASERHLRAGDWVELRAGVRHRVSWTEPGVDTVWLVVFYPPQCG